MPISARSMTHTEWRFYEKQKKDIDPIPGEFASYEEAAEFWDTHDTTDYPEAFQTVNVQADIRKIRYEVEIEDDIIKIVAEKARERGVSISRLVSEMLRRQL